jgi:Shikimate 5'-dehydrogenase C-terminal domain
MKARFRFAEIRYWPYGHRLLQETDVLKEQAWHQFTLWTGQRAPVSVMIDALISRTLISLTGAIWQLDRMCQRVLRLPIILLVLSCDRHLYL